MTANYRSVESVGPSGAVDYPISATLAADHGVTDSHEAIDEQRSLAAGTILATRYRVIEPIGTGGMGAVYLGEHISVGRKVAIKVLLAQWSRVPAIVARFGAEARMSSAIQHPGIIDVLDTGVLPDGRLYLVMEHLAGRDLQHELQQHGPFTPLRACKVIRAAADAIAAAHGAGIIHRDLKPDNIVVTTQRGEETVKVLDFGIAADPMRNALGVASTAPGTVLGTPEHMPPEQGFGDTAGPHFDIYALGSVLFTLLAGRPPFVDTDPLRLIMRKQTEAAPTLVSGGDLPPSLVALVGDALAIQIAERPDSANEFLRRMDEVLAILERSGAGTRAPAGPDRTTGLARTIDARLDPRRPSSTPWRRISAAILAIGLLGGSWAIWRGSAPAPTATLDASAVAQPDIAVEPPSRPMPAAPAVSPTEPPREPEVPAIVATTTGPAAPIATRTPRTTPPARRTAPPSTPALPGEAPTARKDVEVSPPVTAAHLTPRCQQVREQARVAQMGYRWTAVLELSARRECWEQAATARKLETQARMETGDFSGCLTASAGLTDSETTRWRGLCRKRGGSE